MEWHHLVSCFFAGLVLTNALPHLISGVRGEPFQTPFAKPRGVGLSSSTVNVLWGLLNLVIAYVLIFRVGDFDLRNTQDAMAFGVGMLAMGLFCARHFGRFHGGRAVDQA
jgi:hypothetical protein